MPGKGEIISGPRIQMLEADHRVLELLLAGHQEALLGFEFSSALGKLEEFARRLRQHVRAEDEMIAAGEPGSQSWPRAANPELLRAEHRKIEEKLDDLLSSVRGLSRGSSRRAVLGILERGLRFKSLIEHHVRREEEYLLPALRALAGNGTGP